MITNNFSSQDGVSNLVERNGENKSETNDDYSHDKISFLTSSSDQKPNPETKNSTFS